MFLTESPITSNTNKGVAVAIVLVGAFGLGMMLSTQNTSNKTLILIAATTLVIILSVSLYYQHVLDINRAIKRGDFHIHFQPIVTASNYATELIGLEVLLRWEHPALGNIPPVRFINKAEKTGHIIQLTKHLFQLVEQSIAQDDQLKNLSFLNINVSPMHFTVDFSDDASSLLSKGVFINFEITEKAKIRFTPSVHNTISELSDYHSAGLLKTIVSLGRRFNLTIIAEGVETSEQREMLLNLGINLHQGFFYGHPLPLEEITFKSAVTANPRQQRIKHDL